MKNADEAKEMKYLTVKENDFNIKVLVNDIKYFESEGNYLLLFCKTRTYKIRSTIKQMIEILPDNFIQIHRAYIINKKFIEKYTQKAIVINNKMIPISKKHLESLQLEA